jgi:signal peptidase I
VLWTTIALAALALAGLAAAGCGGTQSGSSTRATSTAADRATVRKGFTAFIAAARAGGRAALADRFSTALATGDHRGFGLFTVPSPAMAPAMVAGDRVVGEAIPAAGPQRGDVVVIALTPAARVSCGARTASARQMKRVIGLPGDHIQLVSGSSTVLVNGKPYIVKGATRNRPSTRIGGFDVPPGKLFLLGDNRRASCDSAVWRDPYLPAGNVAWRLAGIYFPADHARLIR